MTGPDTNMPTDTAGAAPPEPRRPRLGDTGRLVDRRIASPNGLQNRYLHNEAQARGELAALRSAVAREPGEVPDTWELTQVEVPDNAGDAPTREEIAVHTAMTLYAVHQQSRTDPMFHPGKGLGHASRELIGPPDQENPSARKRFNAMVTSTTITELRHHLRDLVSLLRARGITLDHAMLADDIVRFQRPGGAKDVRLAWARQYHFMSTADGADSASRTDRTTAPESEN